MSARFSLAADPRRSRQLALALLAAVILVIGAAIAIPAWLVNRHYDTALAANLDKLDRFRRVAGTRPQLRRELEAIAARDPRRYFLRSGAAALSAAQAQEAIRSLVQSSGARLITLSAPASRDEGRYRMVSVNVQLTANIFALRSMLNAIENNRPYLFVDNMTLRTQVPWNFKPAPGAEPEMFLQFDVYGYALAEGKS